MSKSIEISQIAAALTGGQPIAFKQYEDGSLVVIAHTGQKFHFSADQVAEKTRELIPPPPKPAAPKQKASSKPQVEQPLEPKPVKTRAASKTKTSH